MMYFSNWGVRRPLRLLAALALVVCLVGGPFLVDHWFARGKVFVPTKTSTLVIDRPPSVQTETAKSIDSALPLPKESNLATKTAAVDHMLDSMLGEEILTRVRQAMRSQSVETIIGAAYFVDSCIEKITYPGGLGNVRPLNLADAKVRLFEESNRVLKDRCSGLLRIRLEELLMERKRWASLLEREGSATNDRNLYVSGGGLNSISPKMQELARDLLLSAGPDLFFWAPEAMAEIVVHQSENGVFTGANVLARSSTIYMAFELARCDLGFDCGPTSFRTLTVCSNVGACAEDLRRAILESLANDDERSRALAQAKAISDAITSRDVRALGLAPDQFRDGVFNKTK